MIFMLPVKYSQIIFILFITVSLAAQTPRVSGGTIKHFENFHSKFVAPRNIDVWLPDGYDKKRKYAVLYMQDGRALFDSTLMWNRQEWGVDEVMGRLMAEKKIINCIVVGIWNGDARRHSEYFPQKPFESLPLRQQDSIYQATSNGNQSLFAEKIQSDNYLKFLVRELKPFIDGSFSTLKDMKNTFVAGSSMGGLISLYAICEYPGIFGGAACLSTHWPGVFTTGSNPVPAAFMRYLKDHLPAPKNHKIYFDYGSKTLDSLYKPLQLQADAIVQSKGYTAKNWMTGEFPGADHSEKSWNKRLDIPVSFLLGVKK
jgi:enterochelin esterase-like enzyme